MAVHVLTVANVLQLVTKAVPLSVGESGITVLSRCRWCAGNSPPNQNIQLTAALCLDKEHVCQ